MSQAKIAVVVGVGPGLGAAIAHRFASEGFTVALIARSADKLTQIQNKILASGGDAVAIPADVTSVTSLQLAFTQIFSLLGTPEVLVYNAGAFQMAGILDLTPESFENCWKVNCFGAFLAAQMVLPKMLERGQGTILFTGATAALRGSARFAALAVGKFGLRALAQSLAREFGSQGIHVAHVVIDGIINTPKIQTRGIERETYTLLSPEAIAQTYWSLYQQDSTAWTLEIDLRPAVEKF
ncbi:MAG TPA: SDR family NAD(P)-dependent oxidoreductase [Nostocaceae cyanobacterium]|nr:SDR family NAD(P)-dependent oxidoreductase [Nostocaceae cyanobacterium]